jgi:hypothetical protein
MRWCLLLGLLSCGRIAVEDQPIPVQTPAPDAPTDTARVSKCPATVPMDGEPCDAYGRFCEYGSDAKLACNVIAGCEPASLCSSELVWHVTMPDTSVCVRQKIESCPTSYDASTNAACTGSRAQCDYPEGSCHCFQLGHPWTCYPAPAACPEIRPRLGAPCDGLEKVSCPIASVEEPENLGCALDGVACVDGLWRPAFQCPILGLPSPC